MFPTAEQVAVTSIEVLRTAGLSQRKAEYGRPPSAICWFGKCIERSSVKDVASHFADGRLSATKLSQVETLDVYPPCHTSDLMCLNSGRTRNLKMV